MKLESFLSRTLALILAFSLAFCLIAAGGIAHADETPIASAYVYRTESGMPKYWLDLTGAIADSLVLHCNFTDDSSWYEEYYLLDMASAEPVTGGILFHKVSNRLGMDVSNWFEALLVTLSTDSATLFVQRDEKTLAGGAGNTILTGVYPMEAMAAGVVYEYHEDGGQLKYWIYLNQGSAELHCKFLSGDPMPYEEVWTLTPDEAKSGDYTKAIGKVTLSSGEDITYRFRSLSLTFVQGAILLVVERDEKTLAGGAGDNLLSGVYLLEPRTYLRLPTAASYMPEQLGQMAQLYYQAHFNFYPPIADVTDNKNGTWTIHLYEIVDLGEGLTHTATSAWYTVDAHGIGVNDLLETSVNLAE